MCAPNACSSSQIGCIIEQCTQKRTHVTCKLWNCVIHFGPLTKRCDYSNKSSCKQMYSQTPHRRAPQLLSLSLPFSAIQSSELAILNINFTGYGVICINLASTSRWIWDSRYKQSVAPALHILTLCAWPQKIANTLCILATLAFIEAH